MTTDENKKNNHITSQIPKRTTSVQWPDAVDARLNYLVNMANKKGGNVSRSQILAALVTEAPLDGSIIGEKVREYRESVLAKSTEKMDEINQPNAPGRKRKGE